MFIVYEGKLLKTFDLNKELTTNRRFMTDGKTIYGHYGSVDPSKLTLHSEDVENYVLLEEYEDRFHVLNKEGQAKLIVKPKIEAAFSEPLGTHNISYVYKEKPDYVKVEDSEHDYYYNDIFETFQVKDITIETLSEIKTQIDEFAQEQSLHLIKTIYSLGNKINFLHVSQTPRIFNHETS